MTAPASTPSPIPTRTPGPPRPEARAALGPRTWTAVIVVGLVGQIAWVIENMYLNLFVYDTISTDPAVIAIMVAASAIAATVATLVVGAWSDRLGRRREIIAVGYVVWGLLTAAFGLFGSSDAAGSAAPALLGSIIAIIALDCVMSVFGSGANDAAFSAWVTDSTVPANRGRVDGWLAIMPLLGMLLVFGLLDPMTQNGQWTAFFALIGGITALTGVAAWFLVQDRGVPTRTSGVFRSIFDGLRPATIRREPALFITLSIWMVVGIASQVFLPYVLIYLRYSLRLEAYAIALGVVLILASVLSVLGGRVMDRVGKARFLLPAVGVFAAGLIAMAFAREFGWVIAAATLMMAGMMASVATVSAMTRDHTPADRAGGVQGARMIMAIMLPMVIGPAIGAAVISGAAHTYVELGQESPVPGAEIFPVAAAVLVFVPLLALARARVLRRDEPAGRTEPAEPATEARP
ncbi:MFS family permease [Agromyces terreus]|uniref:MFS family permease n=1 Tax=Agromyces terreus TaxID=424795 RepID=A0A9X2KAU9_9MICO|nr:MFS transporter [Agromyces terreus]MCP2369954.1 MFS family permease [Agromyces terreus]